jgi:tRNA (guanine37-N1)-methyltransferase
VAKPTAPPLARSLIAQAQGLQRRSIGSVWEFTRVMSAATAAAAAATPAETGNISQPPAISRIFDRSQFDHTIEADAVEVGVQKCNELRKMLAPYILKRRGQKPIVNSPTEVDPESQKPMKRIIVDPALGGEQLLKLPAGVHDFIKVNGLKVVPHSVQQGYANLSAEQVLRRLLPDGLDVPTSFESVGHLAHFNLRDGQLPYRYLIGQVYLEKSNGRIKTIINKTGTIETQFRTFPMEVLAGEPNTLVQLNEGGAKFRFDYATVYWNSRLQFEHDRLIGECHGPPLAVAGKASNSVSFATVSDLTPF